MSEQKKPRDLYLCKWCERFSYEYSQNGYCQKCFEAKLEKYIEYSALVELQAKYAQLEEKLEKFETEKRNVILNILNVTENYDSLKEKSEKLEKQLQQYWDTESRCEDG